jgi:hypothetical protein
VNHVIVREMEPVDCLSIDATEEIKASWEHDDPKVWAQVHKIGGPCRTICDLDGKILACVGVHTMWKGTGEVWVIFSQDIPPMVYFEIKRLLVYLQEHYGYRRLQATVRPDFPSAVRLAEHLGFKNEGTLEAYGPHGKDCVMYALIRKEG